MISDESSSDSETGRFKSGTTKQSDNSHSTQKNDRKDSRAFERSRPDGDRSNRREYNIKRDNRARYDQRSRDRVSRYSPVRHHSRDRSHGSSRRRSRDRIEKPRDSSSQKKSRDRRSKSREKRVSQQSRSGERSPERKRHQRDELLEKSKEQSVEKTSSSPEYKGKKSIVHKPAFRPPRKHKSRSPIELEVIDSEDDLHVEPGSYYSMVPAIVKEKHEPKPVADESSEIDSSDDERLRAKLLNLEKELKQTRKKKHKKRHKSKSSKSNKEKDDDSDAPVEVSSTTDIQEKADVSLDSSNIKVTSSQQGHKNCSEEGEISSEDNSLSSIEIDSNDLRHRLKRSIKTKASGSPDLREVLKSKDVCGPALPPHLEKSFRDTSVETEGPALPPAMQRTERILGPSIPSDMRSALSQRNVTYESSDEEAIGPLPVGAESKWTAAHKHLEERAMGMKIKKLEGDKSTEVNIKTRETWMLELPEAKAKILGLEARGFRAKEGPDMSDRSSWTDTPEERARKAAGQPSSDKEPKEIDLKREAESRVIEIHDDEQEKAVKKHKKKHKRDESLLELHQKKIKKKKKKDDKDEKKERRPFSRDVDLQVNRFDEAQKRSIIKKAQELDTRFGRGEAKYL